jgi:biotin operon repressor
MPTNRLSRTLHLLLLLGQHDGLSLSQIAFSLGCSHRTVAKDLEVLRAHGIDVVRTASGYRIALTRVWPPRRLDPDGLAPLLRSADAPPLLRSVRVRPPLRQSLAQPPWTI